MVKKFAAYCPLGSKCGKGNSCLGTFELRDDAVLKIQHHLVNSSCHYMKQAEASRVIKEQGSITEYSDDDEDQTRRTSKGGKSKGKTPYSRPSDPIGYGPRAAQRTMPAPTMPAPTMPAPESVDLAALAAAVYDRMAAAHEAVPAAASSSASSSNAIVPEGHVQMNLAEIGGSWTRAVAALVKCEQALKTAARMARSAAQAFEEESHTIHREIEFLSDIQFVQQAP